MLNQSESYQPFVANRVIKIKQNGYVKWQCVPTKQNPADIGSRGSLISKLPKVWQEGSSWLTNSSEWPNQPVIQPLLESLKEAKLEKQFVVHTIEIANTFDKLLEKYELHKALRVSTWVNRFIKNCYFKLPGPLTTSVIEKQRKFYINGEQ